MLLEGCDQPEERLLLHRLGKFLALLLGSLGLDEFGISICGACGKLFAEMILNSAG